MGEPVGGHGISVPAASATVAHGAAVSASVPVESWRLVGRRLRTDRTAMLSLAVLIGGVVFAVCAPAVAAITGHPPDLGDTDAGLTPDGQAVGPSLEFLLGTDSLGRDLLVRIAYGARLSLFVAIVITSMAVGIGVAVGLAAGYLRGVIDSFSSRLVDLVLSLPMLLVAISLVSVTGPGLTVSVAVITAFSWAPIARIVRVQTLSISEAGFVEAARALGATSGHVMRVHVLPSLAPTVVAYTTVLVPTVILAEATLSFLGLGVQEPTATWGGMLSDSAARADQEWWGVIFPATALLAATVPLTLFGDALRDALDPRGERFFREGRRQA